MKAATVAELKKELANLEPAEVTELCLRLARFKKENKELLTYLLYEAHDLTGYLREIKSAMERQFGEMNRSNLYLTKKSLRAIMRSNNKFIRYIGKKNAEVEILIAFAANIRKAKIPVSESAKITNLFDGVIRKIKKAIAELDEDLRYDYQQELDVLLSK
jgi:hypothetical protein